MFASLKLASSTVLLLCIVSSGVVLGEDAINCDNDPSSPEQAMMWLAECCTSDQYPNMKHRSACFIRPPLTRISAEEAFMAYQTQEISLGESDTTKQGVLLLDVRSSDELYWVGQVGQVTNIDIVDDESIIPNNYKTNLVLNVVNTNNGNTKNTKRQRYLKHRKKDEEEEEMATKSTKDENKREMNPLSNNVNKNKNKQIEMNILYNEEEQISTDQIKEMTIEPIAFHVPVEWRDPSQSFDVVRNPNFGMGILEVLAHYNFQSKALVFFCRSGKRSSFGCYYGYCSEFVTNDLSAYTFYEVEGYTIDETTGERIENNGNGGFEGSAYDNQFNGYRGFPGRSSQTAVDFKDAGLPIVIGQLPLTILSDNIPKPFVCTTQQDAGSALALCQ